MDEYIELKGSVLIYGLQAGLYAAFLASITPDCTFTALSVNPLTDRVEDLHLDENVSKRIQYIDLDGLTGKTFDCIVLIDLGNLWLYDKVINGFYSIEQSSEILRQFVAETFDKLTVHLEKDGSVFWLNENAYSLAFAGMFRTLVAYTDNGFDQIKTIPAKSLDELTKLPVLVGFKPPRTCKALEPEQISSLFQREFRAFWSVVRDPLICSGRLSWKTWSKETSFLDRFCLEMEKSNKVSGNEYKIEQSDGSIETVRYLCGTYSMYYDVLVFLAVL